MVSNKHLLLRAQRETQMARVRSAAEAFIFSRVSVEEWQALGTDDKARVCAEVIKSLLDRDKVAKVMAGQGVFH